MPRTPTAWVRRTVPMKVPSAFSIQRAIWARAVGVNRNSTARASALVGIVAAVVTDAGVVAGAGASVAPGAAAAPAAVTGPPDRPNTEPSTATPIAVGGLMFLIIGGTSARFQPGICSRDTKGHADRDRSRWNQDRGRHSEKRRHRAG